MIKSLRYLVFLLLCVGITSCKKPISGCTDCNAVNYNSEAEEDDGCCIYTKNYQGQYEMDERTEYLYLITDRDTVFRSFDFTLQRQECTPSDYLMVDFLNYELFFGDDFVTLKARIVGDSIYISEQFSEEWHIHPTTGYFKSDSIFMDLNFGSIYNTYICWSTFKGKKK